MIIVILDGIILLGLMFLFDRKNPNRDFLETGLVALILGVAGALMTHFLTPRIGLLALPLYFGLCVFLLWKLPEIVVPRALLIAAVFTLIKVAEPYIFRLVLGG
jgi:hypothetical protein